MKAQEELNTSKNLKKTICKTRGRRFNKQTSECTARCRGNKAVFLPKE